MIFSYHIYTFIQNKYVVLRPDITPFSCNVLQFNLNNKKMKDLDEFLDDEDFDEDDFDDEDYDDEDFDDEDFFDEDLDDDDYDFDDEELEEE